MTSIDRVNRTVHVRDLAAGTEYDLPYDNLILSTGAAPCPPIPGIERADTSPSTVPDVERIRAGSGTARPATRSSSEAGSSGWKWPEQLVRHGGLGSTGPVASPGDGPARSGRWRPGCIGNSRGTASNCFSETRSLRLKILARGIRPGVGRGARRRTPTPADTVVLSLGVRPRVQLARDAGLEIGSRGGIRVSEHPQTSDPNIWAVGDAIEVRDAITGAWSLLALAGPANRQGTPRRRQPLRTSRPFKGCWGTSILRVLT